MSVIQEIQEYISSQPEPKRSELQTLHELTIQLSPNGKLWFIDGKDHAGKIIANPNIGYGEYNIRYADGTSRAFFQVGLSANKTGISVYILGKKDKKYLSGTYGDRIGKASVTGYCIKFRTLKDIRLEVLEEAIRYGLLSEE